MSSGHSKNVAPPNSYVETLNPKVMVLGGGVCGRKLGFLFADSQVKRVPCAELRDADRREDHELIWGPLKFE